MSMDRSRRVAELWNWLPAFRVVAEYQSIHKASAVLHVSPSALSRTIRLLEDAVGETLFLRATSGLALTPYGVALLEGTRDAQRRVDDAIASSPTALRRATAVVAGASGAVLPALLARAVGRTAGGARLRVIDVDEDLVIDELLRGDVDVALVQGVALDLPKDVLSERLGELALAVHACDGARLDDVVAPAGLEDVGDRRLIATASSVDAVARIAREAGACAVLPVALAPDGFRLVAPLAASLAVQAVRRRPLGQDGGVMVAIIEAARSLLAEPPR
jgi:DNA-binding transcriptional LysR family regulator